MTIRIDTFRRQLTGLIALVELVRDNADDLHDLATDRARAATVKVRGGQPDYALDNHGDVRARQLLHDIQQRTLDAVEPLHQAAADAASYLRPTHTRTGRRDTTADATSTEILEAIAAQQRRHQRGERTSTATVDQPSVYTPDTNAELELLRTAVRKMAGTTCDLHKEPQPIRLDARLTPAERDAVRRALGTDTGRRKKGRRRAS